jgi:hypothetical protein
MLRHSVPNKTDWRASLFVGADRGSYATCAPARVIQVAYIEA